MTFMSKGGDKLNFFFKLGLSWFWLEPTTDKLEEGKGLKINTIIKCFKVYEKYQGHISE